MEGYVCVYGNGARTRQVGNRGNRYARIPVAQARAAMGIDWMTQPELAQAIPPAYTEWLGHQLMRVLMRAIVADESARGVAAHAR
jgi:DNA (cytosine-5)-methyltransferase 1